MRKFIYSGIIAACLGGLSAHGASIRPIIADSISPSNGNTITTFSNKAAVGGGLSVGTTSAADASAVLDLVSTALGFLPPRMTTTQKNAIGTPKAGLVVYDTTLGALAVYSGSSWGSVGGGGGLSYAADSGSANAYVIAPSPAATLTTGASVLFKAANANTGASTINVNSLGVLALNNQAGAALVQGDILANRLYIAFYDGGAWQLAGAQGSGLTTKGDLATYSTTNTRHPVPSDGGDTIADSTAADGWRNAPYTATQGRPGKNYIQYADFENNSTTGWTATGCATVTNGLPACVGSGAAAFSSSNGGRTKNANTSSPAIVSSSQVAGTYSMSLATTGAGAIGDGYVSSAYTIDAVDQAKVLSYRVSYTVHSGTPVMAGTSANTYAVAIYDVVNNAFIAPAGAFNFIQSSGYGIAQGTFQTASNTTSIQIFIYSPVAPTGASSLYFDDVYVGPQAYAFGPAMSDMTTYPCVIGATTTPPTPGSGSVLTCYRQRIGDHDHIKVEFVMTSLTSAANGSGTYLFPLPAGEVGDTTKVTLTTTYGGSALGGGFSYNGADLARSAMPVLFNTGNLAIELSSSALMASTSATTHQMAGNAVFRFGFEAWVPIVGWSSNSAMSSDTDTRVVAMATSAGVPTGTINGSDNITIFPNSGIKDTHAGYNSGTGRYTVPVTGYYPISANVEVTGTYALNNYLQVSIYVNGSATQRGSYQAGGAITLATATVSDILLLNAGDIVDIRSATTATSPSYTANRTGSYFTISRLTGPAVVAATETVAARYTTASAQTITSSAAQINYDVKDYDTHGAVTIGASWKFTTPVSGTYSITGYFQTVATANSVGDRFRTAIYKNGSTFEDCGVWTAQSTTAMAARGSFNADIHLVAGDTIDLRGDVAVSQNLASSSPVNWIAIKRVGN